MRALNFLEMVLFSLYLHFFIAHIPGSKAMHTKVIIQKSDQTLEDKSKPTASQHPLLRWALSVPGLEEPVDLTVDLRAQPPGT